MAEEQLPQDPGKRSSDILVVGAGLSGLTVALSAAEAGRKVLLIDQALSHGGMVTVLDRQFPTDSCGFCQLLPFDPLRAEACLKSALSHPLIEFLPATELQSVEGQAGAFSVQLRVKATCVDDTRCTRCGKCIDACPETYPDPLQGGILERKPIGYRSPLCAPSRIGIEIQRCTRCGQCVKVCPEGAIQLNQLDGIDHRSVSSIVLATGFLLCNPSLRPELGYGRFPDVVTSLELERLLAKGWSKGMRDLRRPSDNEIPSRIAWVQCVGSRDLSHNYCSSVCCMISLKEARLIRGLLPDAVLQIFYMDMRTSGKGYEKYLQETKSMGIEMIRGRPCEVFSRGRKLYLQAEDHKGRLMEAPFDLIVLSTGLEPTDETRKLASLLGVELDHDGFVVSQPGTLSRTNREGIYVAGAASEPKDIPESVIQACEAAALAVSGISKGSQLVDKTPPRLTDLREEDLRVLVVLCDCCGTLLGGLDFNGLAKAFQRRPPVVEALVESRLCREEGKGRLKSKIEELGINGVVLAACTSRWLRPIELAKFLGLDANLVEVVNIREQILWSAPPTEGTSCGEAATSQIMASLNRMRWYLPTGQSVAPKDPEKRLLVIGGGAAGIAASLAASDMGLEVVLVERERELGGNWRWLRFGLTPGFLPQRMLETSLKAIEAQGKVRIIKGSEVKEIHGRPGHFKAKVLVQGQALEVVQAGAVVIATGGRMLEPQENLLGVNECVMTQRGLELALAERRLNPSDLREVVMIQCVGSRDEAHPYCSRICCASALKNSLFLLEANPSLRLFVLYRDLRAFGTLERYYRMAREKGAMFIPFEPCEGLKVFEDQGRLNVVFWDPLVGARVELRPDRVILSTGISPAVPGELLQSLHIGVDEDGFLKELNPKFKPLDLAEGVYGAGLALAPAFLSEAMAQGRAAALRAAVFLEGLIARSNTIGARVYPSRCSLCGLCVEACPVRAREVREDEGYSVVYAELCQACGSCVAACPNDATQLVGRSDKQTLAAIDALME